MTRVSAARPIGRLSTRDDYSFPSLVSELVAILGKKSTAYVGKVKDVRAVDRWIDGGEPYNDAEERLRFAFQVARTLATHHDTRVVQAWLTGLNPEYRIASRFDYLGMGTWKKWDRRYSARLGRSLQGLMSLSSRTLRDSRRAACFN
jgi:hypothetical protein